MLVIRFFRTGKKNQPSFKIVVTDKTNAPRGGRYVEEVGFYNPKTNEKVLKIERVKYWLGVGAKPSATVYNMFLSEKIIEGKKIPLHKKSKKTEEKPAEGQPAASAPAAPAPAQAPQKPAEAPKTEAPQEVKK